MCTAADSPRVLLYPTDLRALSAAIGAEREAYRRKVHEVFGPLRDLYIHHVEVRRLVVVC